MLFYSDTRLCPQCGGETFVSGGYFDDDQGYIRRRKCKDCSSLYRTIERLDEEMDIEAVNLKTKEKINIPKLSKELGDTVEKLNSTVQRLNIARRIINEEL